MVAQTVLGGVIFVAHWTAVEGSGGQVSALNVVLHPALALDALEADGATVLISAKVLHVVFTNSA